MGVRSLDDHMMKQQEIVLRHLRILHDRIERGQLSRDEFLVTRAVLNRACRLGLDQGESPRVTKMKILFRPPKI